MAIITKPGLQLVYDLIRKENPGLPPNLEEITKLVDGVELPNGRFKARLIGSYGKGMEGALPVTYQRLNLRSLLNGYQVGVKTPVSLYAALGDIAAQYGIVLSQNDIEDVASAPLPHTVKVKAKATSAAYYGEATITLVERVPNLDELIGVRSYKFDLSHVSLTDYTMELLTFGGDYTSVAPQLWYAPAPFVENEVLVSGERVDRLATALKQVDNQPWNEVVGSPHYLVGGKVLFHGKSKLFPAGKPLGRGSQEYVLLIELPTNSTGNANGKSLAYFHYNRWVDAAYAAEHPGPWEV